MKLCLVYTPFCWPTGIPLGIAYLKSYLETQNPSLSVRNLDLNIKFFNSDFNHLAVICDGCSRRVYENCIPPEILLSKQGIAEAVSSFKTMQPFSKSSFARHCVHFKKFFDQLKLCYEILLKPFVEEKGGVRETMIGDLLQRDISMIMNESPDAIGFSANSEQICYALALAKIIKHKYNLPVILGGPFVSYFDGRQTMEAFPFIDFIVYKEGERGLLGLLKNLSGGKFDNVPNLIYRNSGKVIVNKEAWVSDLDGLPYPDFSDFCFDEYFLPHPVLPILFSRGCNWGKCAFCAHYENYSKIYRIRSTNNVLGEIEMMRDRFKARHFLFCDEHIPIVKLKELTSLLIRKRTDIYYGISGLKPAGEISKKVVKGLYDSGCRWIYFGVESLSQRLLDLMRKGTKVRHILKIVKWCKAAGIAPFVSYFWGFPTQTEKDVLREKKICENNSEFFTLADDGGLFCLMKGSDVYLNPQKYKIEIFHPPPFLETRTKTIEHCYALYSPQEGLLPYQARQIFTEGINKRMPYEQSTFWEQLLILGVRRLNLIFHREYHRRYLSEYIYHRFLSFSARLSSGVNKIERSRLYSYEGICLQRLNRHKEAIKKFRKAEKYRPDSKDKARIYFHLGLCYQKQKRYVQALACYENVSKIIPWLNSICNRLGFCYEKSGDYARAVRWLKKAERINCYDPYINFSLFNCYLKINRRKNAQKELAKAYQKLKVYQPGAVL